MVKRRRPVIRRVTSAKIIRENDDDVRLRHLDERRAEDKEKDSEETHEADETQQLPDIPAKSEPIPKPLRFGEWGYVKTSHSGECAYQPPPPRFSEWG